MHFYNPVCEVFPKFYTKKSRSRWARFMKRELNWQNKWDAWAFYGKKKCCKKQIDYDPMWDEIERMSLYEYE